MSVRTYQIFGNAPFVADPKSVNRLGTGAQVDFAAFGDEYKTGVVKVTLTANAAADATALAVTALSAPIPSGSTLYFGESKELALTTALAAAGATAIAVQALPSALESGDVAYYGGAEKVIPAGTRVGTLSGNGLLRPRVVTTNPAIGLLETTAVENDPAAALTGYGVITGAMVYENLLPGATGTPKVILTAEKTELNANGTGFGFQQYSDSIAAALTA